MALEWLKRIVENGIESGEVEQIKALTPKVPNLAETDKSEMLRVIESAQQNASEEAKVALASLKRSIEVSMQNIEYSMEWLKASVEEPKAKQFIELYEMAIANDLATLYGESYENLTVPAKETIKLSFWNIIQSQLGVEWMKNIGIWKITNISDMFSGLFKPADKEATDSILTASLKNKREIFGTIKPENKKDIKKALDMVESLVWKQANNLNSLFKLTTDLTTEQKKQVFENPTILNAIMETGEYKDEWFNINLKEEIVEIGEIDNLDVIQKAFITSIGKDAQGLWDKMEKIKSFVEKGEEFMKAIWMDEGLKKTLYNLPIIGFVFKMILGGFFENLNSAKSLLAINDIIDDVTEEPHKNAMENLRDKFVSDFIKNDETKETPLAKVLSEDTQELYKITPAFLEILDTAGVDYSGEKFWEKIFTWKGAWDNESIIYGKLKSTLNSADLDEEALIKALKTISKTDFAPTPSTQVLTNANPSATNIAAVAWAAWVTTAANQVSASTGPLSTWISNILGDAPEAAALSLEDKVAEITWFPATIERDGEQVKIQIWADGKSIEIWNDSYTIQSMKQWGAEMLGKAFSLSWLIVEWLNWNISFEANTIWKFLIETYNNKNINEKIELKNGNILDAPISWKDIQEIILWLLTNKKHTVIEKDLTIEIA